MGGHRGLTIMALKDAPDQYVSVMYSISADPLKLFLKKVKEKSKEKISFSHILNKLLALAINECPEHNQVVLGNKIYQMEGIHIANILLLPGKEKALANMILDDPHLKSLDQIAIELKQIRDRKLYLYENKLEEFASAKIKFFKFLYATKLNKLVSEKFFYKTGYEMGMLTNLFFSNQVYSGVQGTFTVLRSITPYVNSVVFHTSGTEKRVCVENDQPVVKEILPLTVTYDHRALHGIHAHHFGLVLERIASDPEKYFS